MINKKKICSECQMEKFIWKNYHGLKLCQVCWNKLKPKPVKEKVIGKPINKISKKRRVEQVEYSISRVSFLNENTVCRARLYSICTYNATEVHHAAGRTGSLYLDQDNWIPLCHECHQWVELHPTEAKELELSKSRLSI